MKRWLAVSLVLVLALALNSTAMAQGGVGEQALPGTGWWTSVTLQNTGGAQANFTMAAEVEVSGTGGPYNASGCYVGSGASVIYNPGATPNFNPPTGTRMGFAADCGAAGTDSLPSGFAGGVTVSSDGPLAAVVSVGNNKAGSVGIDGGKASAFYQGFDGAKVGTTLLFPVAKNGFGSQTTTYYIQAVEDASVTVTYSNGDVDGPHAIPAGHTRLFSMPATMDAIATYSAQAVSSSGAIAGTVIEHHSTTSPATFALSTRAFVPDEADTTVYAPVFKRKFSGSSTGMAVLAIGGDVTVEVAFSVTASDPTASCTDSTSAAVNIPDGTSVIFSGASGLNVPAGFGDGCFGSAVVNVTSGTGKIVATVNEASGGNRAVYSAFPASSASQTVAVPLVKEEFNNGRTAVVVQVVGSGTSNVTATYVNGGTCTAGCAVTPAGGNAGTNPISGGAAANFRRVNNFASEYAGTLPATGTNNAVTVTSDSLPVVVIAQEAVTGLDVKNYEGFPQ